MRAASELMSGLGIVVVALGVVAGMSGGVVPPAPVAPPVPVAAAAPTAAATPVVQAALAAPSTPTPPSTPAEPATPVAPTPPPDATPCDDLPTIGTAACVDLSARKTWLVRDGQIVQSGGALGGRKGYATPTGTFRVQWRDIDHVSSQYEDAPMPYSVFFNGGIAFHQGSLSSRSHGCLHLAKSTARSYYENLRVGDTVQVVA